VIAGRLGRSPSSVSREIDRNGGRGAYRAVDADAAAYDRALRPKPSKLATNPALRERVVALLVQDWSPQQIAARLHLQHPDVPALRVSHETIYRDLYMPSRKVFDASMFHRLRSERPIRRPRGKMSSHGRGRIRNMVSIHARPVEADDRQVAGHGREIWCLGPARRRSRRRSTGRPASLWSSACPTGTRPTRSPPQWSSRWPPCPPSCAGR